MVCGDNHSVFSSPRPEPNGWISRISSRFKPTLPGVKTFESTGEADFSDASNSNARHRTDCYYVGGSMKLARPAAQRPA